MQYNIISEQPAKLHVRGAMGQNRPLHVFQNISLNKQVAVRVWVSEEMRSGGETETEGGANFASEAVNPQPSTLISQPSTLNPQPSTSNPQSSARRKSRPRRSRYLPRRVRRRTRNSLLSTFRQRGESSLWRLQLRLVHSAAHAGATDHGVSRAVQGYLAHKRKPPP